MLGLILGLVAGSVVVAWKLLQRRDATRAMIMVGAAVLIARANGLDEKVFRDKLTQMIVNNETTFAVGIAASMLGKEQVAAEIRKRLTKP